MCANKDELRTRLSYRLLTTNEPFARNAVCGEIPIDVLAEPRSARRTPADEIGRTDGVRPRRRRREHHQALRMPGHDVHASGTALMKADDKRGTKAEEHVKCTAGGRPRIASERARPLRSHSDRAIGDPATFPTRSARSSPLSRFTLRERFRFEMLRRPRLEGLARKTSTFLSLLNSAIQPRTCTASSPW
jgi:hypothetical protein